MNRVELKIVLDAEQIKENTYSLVAKDFDPNEVTCLRKKGESWVVYYSERGLQTGKELFKTESEACIHLLELLRSDPTTRSNWKSGFSL
ncbi:hypothetical protein GCM10008107_27100 [Psychrosphaera saromensis]|uniref:Uncharacterized protein n=1 Tax=Psychrosphaera saromensis TaxID=716813 RepID=A0A2S7UZ95_9GAMM|nr:hypothetical protein [Psychrosphaera saromensis]PQJ55257.1 hypothetical protein BTO11_10410 [Psychrosphaera saromensis]GHB76213.1 hypothetical protein GCM10008107_27100 [Psychrosphaera saromensis]GLQ14487.1 hypothetical protein GCM10007917_19420 [Psychrosphaera saromensis]